jgi:predicted secreted protein
MAATAGKGGKLVIGAADGVNIASWSLSLDADMLETTALGDDWKEFLAGLNGWTVSVEAHFDKADTTGQIAIQNAILAGTSLSVKLYVDDTNYYSGTVYVSNQSINDSVSDLVTASYSLQGSGALSYA